MFDKSFDDERHRIELGHTQIVFIFGDFIGWGKTMEKHPISTTHQMLHLITRKIIASHAKLNAPLYCAGSCFTFFVCKFPISFTTIALNILSCIILMPEIFPPPINKLLTSFFGRRSCCTKVASIPTITMHLSHVNHNEIMSIAPLRA